MNDILKLKNRYAQRQARRRYAIDPDMHKIFRVLAPATLEQDAGEPVKFLQVSKEAAPIGILPLFFPIIPGEGFPFKSVIIEISLEEFAKIKARELTLPNGWKVGPLIPTSSANGRRTKRQ